jgi:hypothetical protein
MGIIEIYLFILTVIPPKSLHYLITRCFVIYSDRKALFYRTTELGRNIVAAKISGKFVHIFTLHLSQLYPNSVPFLYIETRIVSCTRKLWHHASTL